MVDYKVNKQPARKIQSPIHLEPCRVCGGDMDLIEVQPPNSSRSDDWYCFICSKCGKNYFVDNDDEMEEACMEYNSSQG